MIFISNSRNFIFSILENQVMHPLVITADFAYEFLSIHPKRAGIGSLSRFLTILLIMNQDYQIIHCVSFENIIEEIKDEHYRVLMEGQKDRYQDTERIDAWIQLFMQCPTTYRKAGNREGTMYHISAVKILGFLHV